MKILFFLSDSFKKRNTQVKCQSDLKIKHPRKGNNYKCFDGPESSTIPHAAT